LFYAYICFYLDRMAYIVQNEVVSVNCVGMGWDDI